VNGGSQSVPRDLCDGILGGTSRRELKLRLSLGTHHILIAIPLDQVVAHEKLNSKAIDLLRCTIG
jgi:hypothetical protein